MDKINKLKALIKKFSSNFNYYQDNKNAYNEQSCRIEYIEPFLAFIGWDVTNEKGLAPQYREVIAENYSNQTDRPDYTLTLRGVAKLFVEVKKPSVDIINNNAPAIQARKYGWNAKHKIVILTNFDNLIIYDTTIVPRDTESSSVARYRIYHYTEYIEKFSEITQLISKGSVYSGDFDKYFNEQFSGSSTAQKKPVDKMFLDQINTWRVKLSNELYIKDTKYHSLEILNDVVQRFINQIVFIRICEDRSLPLYHNLIDLIKDKNQINKEIEKLIRAADKRYNSGMFSGESIVFDINNEVIIEIIRSLYYPESPYLFSIIEPNMLGKIYELFLTEQLVVLPSGDIGLAPKKECENRSIVTTPTEIVKYMTDKSMSRLVLDKSPTELLSLKIADIACGSGVFLESVFDYLQNYCVEWYLKNEPKRLIEIGNDRYKLPLEEKKALLCSCIFGIDIDIHAVEVAKFSLLIKLIENETAPSVVDSTPILPDLGSNIGFGNSLITGFDLQELSISQDLRETIVPFNWSAINNGNNFDLIIGNPPYVNTEGLHLLIPELEFNLYKKHYKSAYKQFDKYFLFVESALRHTKNNGFVCYIIPNKFFKNDAGKNLRAIIASISALASLDDFGDAQLFGDKTIYSSIILLQTRRQQEFQYRRVDSPESLWAGENIESISVQSKSLSESPWRLTTDIDFMKMLQKLDRVAVSLTDYVDIFNGIQTSAERPKPVYWFSDSEIVDYKDKAVVIQREDKRYEIELDILKPFFKPMKKNEKGLNSYSELTTDKHIIFPYDKNGELYPIDVMRSKYPGAYRYLEANYSRLVPKTISSSGIRDVPNATADTWYQYGRTQALTSFINRPKLIVGILSKEPLYAYDRSDMLIASGGTAGYCAISRKTDCPYALEYIQAWLTNRYTERILEIIGSDFENGFISRGTFVLSQLPFIPLDFTNPVHRNLHDGVVEATKAINDINKELSSHPSEKRKTVLLRHKSDLIKTIESEIGKVYRLEF
jgi:type I restriction-modification system DNA methylase subunit